MAEGEVQEEETLDAEAQALEERLKSALWYRIGRIVDDETLKLGVNATPQFIGSLTELAWAQIGTAAQDLESFAAHAGRRTIKTDDVLLLGRRNEGLEAILKNFVEGLKVRKADAVANGNAKGNGKRKAKSKAKAKQRD